MKPKKHQFPTPSEEELSSYLRGAHGGLEGGETLVEGSKNGDHPLRDGLALVQRLPQEARPPLQGFRPLWNLHFPGSIPRRGGTNLRRKPLPASGAASLLTDRRLPAPAADHISGRILTGSLSTSAPPSPPLSGTPAADDRPAGRKMTRELRRQDPPRRAAVN